MAGAAYVTSVNPDHKKSYGLYLTPPTIAAFMAKQIVAGGSTVRILDPAAGAGVLLCAAVEELAARDTAPRRIELVAYEVDAGLIKILTEALMRLKNWAGARGIEIALEIAQSDFVLEHAGALRNVDALLPLKLGRLFDAIIANPPYFKLNKADPRAKAAASVVYGQPNIYGVFMRLARCSYESTAS
jgi:adenine-specific DNA-methyltransferase